MSQKFTKRDVKNLLAQKRPTGRAIVARGADGVAFAATFSSKTGMIFHAYAKAWDTVYRQLRGFQRRVA